jgi:hypothetical protein
MWKQLLLMVLLILAALPVIAQDATPEVVTETAVTPIQITGPAAERDAEISGMVWYGDDLLLITENPFLYAEDDVAGKFFALEKADILEYLFEGENTDSLNPIEVPIYGPDIIDAVGGFEVAFDGFEAAVVVPAANAFADDQIFLTIEADTVREEDPSMRGYLVWGSILPTLSGIELRLDNYIALPTQTEFGNMSYETLIVTPDNHIVALYEVNGATANPQPVAVSIDLATGEASTIPVENIEFRVTDATMPDADGRFWVMNYFFPGETFLAVDSDPLFEQYGMGTSQAAYGGYERIVAMQYSPAGITRVDQAPIQLLQTDESNGRNWEGVETLEDRGLLVVTDRFPETILGFVPFEGE